MERDRAGLDGVGAQAGQAEEEVNRLLISRQLSGQGTAAGEVGPEALDVGLEPYDVTPSCRSTSGTSKLDGVRFVITLDSDTQLPHGAAPGG